MQSFISIITEMWNGLKEGFIKYDCKFHSKYDCKFHLKYDCKFHLKYDCKFHLKNDCKFLTILVGIVDYAQGREKTNADFVDSTKVLFDAQKEFRRGGNYTRDECSSRRGGSSGRFNK
jgi:hypothetical protein